MSLFELIKVGELKDVLEGQSGLYTNYYTRFQQEIAADNE